jgi:hypothetical protein
VRAIVIHDQMQGHGRGKLFVQAAEKFQEFLMSVSLITLPYDRRASSRAANSGVVPLRL